MWSKDSTSIGDGGKKIEIQGWHVVDATTKALALATSGLPQYNDQLEPGSAYRVRRINCTNYNGPYTWLVIVEFAIPDGGSFGEPPDDPLQTPIKWTVRPFTISKVSETDVTGRLKKNAAGDIFPPIPKEYQRYEIIARRYERFWNDNKNKTYEGKVNSNAMVLGSRTVGPYELILNSYAPDTDFEDDADFILMAYRFEVGIHEQALTTTNPRSGYPFESHYANIGSFGWYTFNGTTSRGRFCRVDSVNRFLDYADNIPLTVLGRPVDSTIKVKPFEASIPPQTAVQNPNSAEHMATDDQSPFHTANLPMWLYKDHQSVDMSGVFSIP